MNSGMDIADRNGNRQALDVGGKYTMRPTTKLSSVLKSAGLLVCLALFPLSGTAQVIGDFVWEDLNTNGIQDVSEPGVSGVLVTLYDSNTNSLLGTLTDTNGYYAFTNQPNDTYFLTFIPPLGYAFTLQDASSNAFDDVDSDANDAGATEPFVYSGGIVTNIDAGIYQLTPGATVTKLAGSTPQDEILYTTSGVSVTYTYIVTNTGNTFFTPAFLDDDKVGTLTTVFFPDLIAPGQVLTTNVTLTITNSVTNIATFVGIPTDFKGNPLGFPPFTTNDDAIVVVVAPGYDIEKSIASPTGRTVGVNEQISFNLTLTNTGDVDLVTVPLIDVYDTTYLSFVGAVPPTIDTLDDGTVEWADVGPLPIGATTNIVVTFTAVASTVATGSETNTVITTPTTPTNFPPVPPKTNDVPYDISNPSFSVVKTVVSPSGRAAAVGEDIVFQLTVSNTGDVDFVTLPLDDVYDTSYLTYSTSAPAANDTTDGALGWTDVGPLPVGASTSVTVTMTALASTPVGGETNTVVASPTTPPTDPPVPPQTNDVPYDISNPGFTLIKNLVSPSGRKAAVGEDLVFNLILTNTGDVDLVTVPLNDTYDTVYATYLSSVPPADVTINGNLSWSDVGPVPAGASTTVVVTLTALASTPVDGETNTVVASPTTPPTEPPVPPQTNDEPYEISNPGFQVTKVQTSPVGRSAIVGENVEFTLIVTNSGDVGLVTVPLADTYETAYLTYVSSVPPADDTTDGALVWNDVGPLPIGGVTSVTVTLNALLPTLGNSRTNTVVASPTTPPTDPPVPPETNEVPYEVRTIGYDLTKTLVSPLGRRAAVGELIIFNLTLSNTGEVDFATVPLDDTFDPQYLAYASATPPADNVGTGLVQWLDVGPVPAGASTTVVVRFTALDGTVDDQTNTVVATPTTPAPEPPVPPQTNDEPYSIELGTIGDTVWLDINGNGIVDEDLNQYGLNGIWMTLYLINGGATTQVTQVYSVSTNGQRGFYLFDELPDGEYRVEVDINTLPTATPTNGPNAGQILTLVPTTPLAYNILLDGDFLAADFGFYPAIPTAVDLISFDAEPVNGDEVLLTWETAMERNNSGYYLLRASAPGAPRTRVNDALIPGSGSGAGQSYQYTDRLLQAEGDVYYWLVDVEYSGARKVHGPVRVTFGEKDANVVADVTVDGGSFYMITADALTGAGISLEALDPEGLGLLIDGQEAAMYVSAWGSMMTAYDFLLFHAPGNGTFTAELVQDMESPARMASVYAGPSYGGGDAGIVESADGLSASVAIDASIENYLVTGLQDGWIWVLDVTHPYVPTVLLGAETVYLNGESGLYFSYPVDGASIRVIGASAINTLDASDLK